MRHSGRTGWLPGLVGFLILASLAGFGPSLEAQEGLEAVAGECAGGTTSLAAPCARGALGARGMLAGVGVLAAQGSDVPGSATTLGFRLGTAPRIAVSGRAAGARLSVPDVRTRGRGAESFAWTLQGHAAAGVFQGFSPMPQVGGILALDLEAMGGVLLLPGSDGYQGDAGFWGLGARLGVLRESFTFPGVSVSLVYRNAGALEIGALGPDGDPRRDGAVSVDGSITSIRATVGKDLLALGLMAGIGWDRYSGDVELAHRATTGGGGGVIGRAAGSFDDSRVVYFGGVGFTFLVLQLSGEVGWAQGFDADGLQEGVGDGFDPSDTTFFAGLALRLTI